MLVFSLLIGSLPSAGASPEKAILGTWRFVSINGREINGQFYVKYQSDGTALSWPSPDHWKTTKDGVSYGKYEITQTELIIDTGQGARNARTSYSIDGEVLRLKTPSGDALEYRLEKDAPPPGRLKEKRPNKAPEPTPGAVTPRATEGTSK